MSTTFKVSPKSWHFKLVRHWYTQHPMHMDFCQYTRAVGISVLVTLMCACMMVVILYFPVDFMGWVAAMVAYHQWIAPDYGAGVMLGLIVVIAFGYGCQWIEDAWRRRIRRKWQERIDAEAQEAEGGDPIVKGWYQSWRGKFCMKLEILEK